MEKSVGIDGFQSKGLVSNVLENGSPSRYEWLTGETRGVAVHLLNSPSHFQGPIYVDSPPDRPFWDDSVKFSFFSEACLDLIRQLNPDIVHVNDWPLGYLLGQMAAKGLRQARVLTIHNVQYQGNFWEGLLKDNFSMRRLLEEHPMKFRDPHPQWGCVNALRLGVECADIVNTVSPTYAHEMTQPPDADRFFAGGCGLEAVLGGLNQGSLIGILNGFEYNGAATEGAFREALRAKMRARAQVAREFSNPERLLLGFVGRAVEQKLGLLAEVLRGQSVLEHLLAIPGVNIALLGTGEQRYEKFLAGIPERRAGGKNYQATLRYDAEKAKLISKGCDVFLMPSLFEPCGIAQLESMANATPPLVRRTGGLADTVVRHTEPGGTGFVFDGGTREGVLDALVDAVRDAVGVSAQNPERFLELQWNCFQQRFLWQASAQRYQSEIYARVLDLPRAHA